MKTRKPIHVTKSYLPPLEDYVSLIKKSWNNNWLTNRGELVLDLEEKLKEYLGVDNIIATTNGTLPLQIAIKALSLKGEIITTAFSYVATTSSIVWENCTPVFVDIHPYYWTIDEEKIEAAITSETTAILATHVFGNPCNVLGIERIAQRHNLKVIYDAAHSFGVSYLNKSIFTYGDVSTCSFHATKLFHTGEGGAMFSNDENLRHKLYYHHNFGHKGTEEFWGIGINAKMSEVQAAMGLAVFPHLDEIISSRKSICELYDNNFASAPLKTLTLRQGTSFNYAYYPIVFESERILLNVQERLNENHIFPRRYFYPSLNKLSYVKSAAMPISEKISKTILCLPLYPDLPLEEVGTIAHLVNKAL